METEPDSLLTRERPDIWARGLALAASHTGLVYLPKVPTPEGVIYACGSYPQPYSPPPENTPAEIKRDKELERLREIEDLKRRIERARQDLGTTRSEVTRLEKALAELEADLARKQGFQAELSVVVPEGAMEWLLHEMGHWVAATPEERVRPNYGIGQTLWGRDAEQEWQAWAFEEIILAPWGHARHLAPPSQQDGVGYSKAGPIAASHLDHAARQMQALGVDVEQWRAVYGEWIRWERRRSSAFGLS